MSSLRDRKWFSVLINCYGDHPKYSLRAIESVVGGKNISQHVDLFVGLSQCCRKTQRRCRKLYDRGRINLLVESAENINKDPMMRILLERVTTPYFLWLDDDSYFVDSAWPAMFGDFIEREHPFDAAGHVFFWNSSPETEPRLWQWLSQKPWWRGRNAGNRDLSDTRIFFPTGGLFVARTAFARKHGFPDHSMVKRQDDIILGELLNQQHGKLLEFDRPIMNTFTISDAPRRGSGESESDLLACDPVTGEPARAEDDQG